MKKTLYLIIAFLMVLGCLVGCQSNVKADAPQEPAAEPEKVEATAEPAEEPEETPKLLIELTEVEPDPVEEPAAEPETPNPDAARKNTPEEIRAIAEEYCNINYNDGYDPAKHDAAFTYARMPKDEDWSKIFKNMKEYYTYFPYNMFVSDLGNQPSKFQTNKELVEELGNEKLKAYENCAANYADYTASNIPEQMNSDTLYKQFKNDCGLPDAKAHQYAEQKLAYYNAYKFFRDSLIQDLYSLIYRDTEGILRVRMEYNVILRSASDEYLTHTNTPKDQIGVWTGATVEVKIFTDNDGNITDMEIVPISDMQVRAKGAQKYLTEYFNELTA